MGRALSDELDISHLTPDQIRILSTKCKAALKPKPLEANEKFCALRAEANVLANRFWDLVCKRCQVQILGFDCQLECDISYKHRPPQQTLLNYILAGDRHLFHRLNLQLRIIGPLPACPIELSFVRNMPPIQVSRLHTYANYPHSPSAATVIEMIRPWEQLNLDRQAFIVRVGEQGFDMHRYASHKWELPAKEA